MVGEERFTCPECGRRSMVKVKNEENKGSYMLKCLECGLVLGPLPAKNVKDLIS